MMNLTWARTSGCVTKNHIIVHSGNDLPSFTPGIPVVKKVKLTVETSASKRPTLAHFTVKVETIFAMRLRRQENEEFRDKS
jgi:hypothetical protein